MSDSETNKKSEHSQPKLNLAASGCGIRPLNFNICYVEAKMGRRRIAAQ